MQVGIGIFVQVHFNGNKAAPLCFVFTFLSLNIRASLKIFLSKSYIVIDFDDLLDHGVIWMIADSSLVKL